MFLLSQSYQQGSLAIMGVVATKCLHHILGSDAMSGTVMVSNEDLFV
jgi:hypothetical protein